MADVRTAELTEFKVDTFGAPYPKSEDPNETISQGGYSSHMRAHEYFTFPIPENIPSHEAAPMMCAGLVSQVYNFTALLC